MSIGGAWFPVVGSVHAMSYPLPTGNDGLIGTIETVAARYEDTLLDIAVHYGIGQEEIVWANPHVDRWLPGEGTPVIIPSSFILPRTPLKGLVLNLPEMRLYFYPKAGQGKTPVVETYPVSIGRQDWDTPQGTTRIISKVKNPAWYPPDSIRLEHEQRGESLPRVVPPGPDNPLGNYALKLEIPGYLIHGTNKTFGIGLQASHGCIRLSPGDIEQLFPQVASGTAVRIVNQPAKAGWLGDTLYLEVHPLLENLQHGEDQAKELVDAVHNAVSQALRDREVQRDRRVNLNTVALEAAIRSASGLPVAIATLQ
ncbi:L,D-transpeptidase family protein [Aestuariicella hydrocarbonica]|uniref:L,D-transpeptidase family protein n=2 Tax=Pseudomaricurvus hydrocarbonicus TaxID=1470433 RepID=A0A9E5JUK2_9GAMM|nr:L,D-transpeptidase family protein [Aestuariicella hydrocarbonica]